MYIPPGAYTPFPFKRLLSDTDQIGNIVLLCQLCNRSVLCQLGQICIYDVTQLGVALFKADCVFLGIEHL